MSEMTKQELLSSARTVATLQKRVAELKAEVDRINKETRRRYAAIFEGYEDLQERLQAETEHLREAAKAYYEAHPEEGKKLVPGVSISERKQVVIPNETTVIAWIVSQTPIQYNWLTPSKKFLQVAKATNGFEGFTSAPPIEFKLVPTPGISKELYAKLEETDEQ